MTALLFLSSITAGIYEGPNIYGTPIDKDLFLSNLGDDASGQYCFNGHYTAGGLCIIDGDIYAQTGYFVNITALNITHESITITDTTDLLGNFSVDTSTFFVNSNTDRVGIKTSSPSESLDIAKGKLELGFDDANDAFNSVNDGNSRIYTSGQAGGGYPFQNRGNLILQPRASSGSDIVFATGGATPSASMTILDTGNVGIGTTSPTEKFEISSADSGIAILDSADSNNIKGTMQVSVGNGGFIDLYNTAESNTVKIRSYAVGDVQAFFTAGNIGIGTTSPERLLHTSTSLFANIPLFERSGQAGNAKYVGAGTLSTKTADMTDGFGSLMGFHIRDNANVINPIGYIGAVRDGADTEGALVFLAGTSGNEEFMRIDNDGNVGIGTSSPQYLLHLNSTSGNDFVAEDDSGSMVFFNAGTNEGLTGTLSNHQFKIRTNNIDAIIIDTSQNVGIGTTSPQQLLEVESNTHTRIGVQSTGTTVVSTFAVRNSTGSLLWEMGKIGNENNFRIYENGSSANTRFMIANGGNIGIGTTIPLANLHINGISTSTDFIISDGAYPIMALRRTGTVNDINVSLGVETPTGNEQFYIGTSNGDIEFKANGNDNQLFLAEGGNVGIGTNNPQNTLNVLGDLNVTGNLYIGGNVSMKRPYGMFSSNESQIVLLADTVYTMNFSHVEDQYLMYLNGDNENITIQQSGDYLITLSVIVVTDTNNKHFNIFPQSTHRNSGVFQNVPRSNTRVEIENAGTEQIIAVPFILDFDAGDKFRIMYSSDDAGSMTVWTAGSGAGINAIPETPSIIMTINKISEITD
jgi:hypothetical protein